MERSEIRVGIDTSRSFPDFAALHPGYLLDGSPKSKPPFPIEDGIGVFTHQSGETLVYVRINDHNIQKLDQLLPWN
jgi:hypothetical protein